MSTRKIQLKLLGPLRVTAGSEDLTAALSQPKRLALVTWLLLTRPPGLHRRDTLCALLWPESSDEKARATLRWLLSTLRRELGDQTFLTEGDLVGINQAIVSSDAGALLEALEAGQDADAVDLYAGELLPGLHLAEGEGFERWFEERRGELRRGVTRAAWRLVERAEADGNVAEAQRWAERALAIDAEDEAGLRRLMTLHARSGDRAAALRTYETFARRLKEDWATDPEPATLELVERIRAGALAPFPEARHSRPDLPAAMDQVLHKATAKAPADRYPTAGRIADAVPSTVGDVPSVKRIRTRRRWLGPVIGGIAVALALVGYRVARIDTSLIGKRVLVVPFANHTGNPNLDAMGMVAADWVIQGLQRSGIAEVVDPATAFLTTRDLPNRAPESMSALRELAAATHAGLLIVGAVTVVGDSAEYTARLVDVRNARVLRVVDPIRARVADPSVALNELRSRLAGSVAAQTDAQVIPLGPGERPPTLEAYQDFVAGMEEFVVGGPHGGRSNFQQAIARDSSFTLAMMWLFYTFWNEGMDDSSLATVKRIADGPDRNTPLVKAWVAVARGSESAPIDQQLSILRRAAGLSPGSHNDVNLASYLVRHNRPHEAIEILQRFDVSRNWVTRWYVYWDDLIRAKHMIGDYRGELAVARRARRRVGEPYNGEEIAALAALGDVTSLRSVLDSAYRMRVLGAHPDPFIIAHASHELEAHGHLDAAIALLSWAEPLLRERLATDSSIAIRVAHAWTQATLANYRGDRQLAGEARQVLERLILAMPSEQGIAETPFLTALCTEGDSTHIARLPYPLHFPFAYPIVELEIAVCKGDRDGADSLLTTLTATDFAHWLPVLRPLRKAPRFQRWLRPRD